MSVFCFFFAEEYLEGGRGIEHILQTEVAAAFQVLSTEVLNELHVVETIRQCHVLLQTHIWERRGSHQPAFA